MTQSHEELFQRYTYAGAIARDPAAVADLFAEDGVFEAPLLPEGHPLPRRLVGRRAIEAAITDFHAEPAYDGPVDTERSRYVLHETDDPEVFIAEIDTVFALGTMSLVQIFRVRDGKILLLRDYFAA
ncbi:nuclear transport factor 2 family protein [Dactylosporangium sp. CA-139066]|uniref:nuclear transport factor 2 family protein n=1 Tax=Dactylosporangium sp. CA-139066 TaxID=3239930 RepID=UPI003D921E9F